MSDTKDTDRPAAPGRPPMNIKRTEGAGTVRQSFSHGRTKAVVVEKKKVRRPGADGKPGGPDKPGPTPEQIMAKKLGLSEEEVRRRLAALEAAKAAQADRAAKQAAEEEARRGREAAERQALEDERRRQRDEEEARQRVEAGLTAEAPTAQAVETAAPEPATIQGGQARPKPARDPKAATTVQAPDPAAIPGETAVPRIAKGTAPVKRNLSDEAEELGGRVKAKRPGAPGAAPAAPARPKSEPEKRRHKLTIVSALDDEGGERQRSIAAMRRAREKEKQRRMMGGADRDKVVREVVVPEVITVQELANRMAERAADIVKFLMKQGQMVRAVDALDADTAELIVEEFGHTVKRVSESDVEEGFLADDDPDGSKQPRAPIVTIMGHVDHGKTSLLDALRHTDVAAGEAGGITQHIGAYQVRLASGERITFLDTPGHAAFSSMRARGANITDIVILVVAADDGVMPQTAEAIAHAKAAKVPIIVAVNKMDKPDAKPDRVLNGLLQHEIVVEAFGGEVQAIEVSALKRMGLDNLTEAIVLQSEMLDLKANPDRTAEGVVVESQLDRGKGPVATVLVKRGTLKRGDLVVAGAAWGRVRALSNERGQQLTEAGPATPVEVLGLSEPPEPGEPFAVVENEARARELTEYRERLKREKSAATSSGGASLEQLMARLKDKAVSELPVIVKADVQGSAEAIAQAIEKIGNAEVRARVIHSAVGGINESDVLLARTSGAPIIAFNTRPSKQARDLAERERVEIRYYSIIYDVLDDMKSTLQGMLAPEKREEFLGYAQILQVFAITKVGKVAGCRISEGVVKRGCGVRLLRDNVVVHEGKLSTLKRFKDEVAEVTSGQECGMAFENYQDIQEGDQIECFTVVEVQRTLA